MEIQLLTNEKAVKAVTGLADNLAGEYLSPAIGEAQEIKLKGIIGSNLLKKLKDLIADEEIDAEGNEAYQELALRCQYYLAYQSAAQVIVKVSFKIGNVGAVRTNDENVQSISMDEVLRIKAEYQGQADFYCHELQKWIVSERSSFPELSESCFGKIQANLKAADNLCPIFGGGARGFRIPR